MLLQACIQAISLSSLDPRSGDAGPACSIWDPWSVPGARGTAVNKPRCNLQCCRPPACAPAAVGVPLCHSKQHETAYLLTVLVLLTTCLGADKSRQVPQAAPAQRLAAPAAQWAQGPVTSPVDTSAGMHITCCMVRWLYGH